MNVKYNYLIGKTENLPLDYDIGSRSEPETDGCKRLYDDLIALFFFNDAVANLEQQFPYNPQKCKTDKRRTLQDYWNRYNKLNNENAKKPSRNLKPPYYTIKYINHDILLSADYIGPSIFWIKNEGIEDKKVVSLLNTSRTIGGHIVWPRGFGQNQLTINCAKGGSKGVYDRIDWTLQLAKIFYETKDNKYRGAFLDSCKKFSGDNYSEYENAFRNMYNALSNSKEWFELIGNFNDFCKKFRLKGAFVDEKNNIIWFANPFPIMPKNYLDYAEKNCNAVEMRNMQIVIDMYGNLATALFYNGNEIHTRSDILNKARNMGWDDTEVDDIIDSLLSVGFMHDTGNNCYIR